VAKIKLFAYFRTAAGINSVTIKEASIREVVTDLVKQYPALSTYLLENGQLRPQVIITKNGQLIHDMDTFLSDQDVIAFFPPIGGG
jgi:MoaD family protein